MAAIVGIQRLRGNSQPIAQSRWHEATTAMASRSRIDPVELVAGSTRVQYRGPSSNCLLDEHRLSVLIDGHIDNLSELLKGRHLLEASPARQVRDLYQNLGQKLFELLTGDFALAVVSHETGRTYLVRDRFGSRSLFSAALPQGWCWASEIKGLTPFLEHPSLDRRGLAEVLHYRWLVGDRTLVAEVRRVLAGTFITLGDSASPEPQKCWSIPWNPSAPRRSR